jgi:hypothetical protein
VGELLPHRQLSRSELAHPCGNGPAVIDRINERIMRRTLAARRILEFVTRRWDSLVVRRYFQKVLDRIT